MNNSSKIISIKPFLRWAGGKTWLLKHLDKIILDNEFNNYHEPFLGSGAVFLALKHSKQVFLSDINLELINTYIAIKEHPSEVIKILKEYKNTKEFYYKIRKEKYEDIINQAARFIYLNQTSFNGLYRVNYGTGLRTKYWRTLQRAIAEARPEFNPEGLQQYWIDNAKEFNDESFRMIRDIEIHFRNDFKVKLIKKYYKDWFTRGLPKPVYDAASKLAADKNYENIDSQEKVDPWNCLTIINYREIATYGSNWSELFEKEYTMPGEEKISGGKQAKTEWFAKLSKIRNQNFHTYSVTEEEYKFLKNLYDWLIKKDNIIARAI